MKNWIDSWRMLSFMEKHEVAQTMLTAAGTILIGFITVLVGLMQLSSQQGAQQIREMREANKRNADEVEEAAKWFNVRGDEDEGQELRRVLRRLLAQKKQGVVQAPAD